MTTPEPSISIAVDPTNPGQFFACCGLLELADRLWPRAEGWFSPTGKEFYLNGKNDEGDLLEALANAAIVSSMSAEQTARLKTLKNLKKTLRTPEIVAETQHLDSLWERERLHLSKPFDLWLDWWCDDRAGGGRLKTWAGKQFISDIVRGMQAPLRSDTWKRLSSSEWLRGSCNDRSLPFYFDSDIGSHSSSIDVGFSLDSLDMRGRTRPLIELAAFIGLQRFRPAEYRSEGTFGFCTWTEPLPPILAAVACNGALPQAGSIHFTFRLLYRTKYLKGFLPATA
jgi:CRISPR-associated protein Csb3